MNANKIILLTGEPGVGKSTILGEVVSTLSHWTGIITHDLREGMGQRVGFASTFHGSDGRRATALVAHKRIKTDYPFPSADDPKYYVDVAGLEYITHEANQFEVNDVLVLDEIGPMQMFCPLFPLIINHFFESRNLCIATIANDENDRGNRLIRQIKARSDVKLLKLTKLNRGQVLNQIHELLNEFNPSIS